MKKYVVIFTDLGAVLHERVKFIEAESEYEALKASELFDGWTYCDDDDNERDIFDGTDYEKVLEIIHDSTDDSIAVVEAPW